MSGGTTDAAASGTEAPAGRVLFVVLLVLSIIEIATLALLLMNLTLLHVRPIAQLIGPVHGAVYLVVVMIAVFAPGLRRRDRALGFIPVVGGALAVLRLRRERKR